MSQDQSTQNNPIPIQTDEYGDSFSGIVGKYVQNMESLGQRSNPAGDIYVREAETPEGNTNPEMASLLADAAVTCRTMMITYQAWGSEEHTTQFDPYGLVHYDGDLFAVGMSGRTDAIEVFKVNRMREAKTTESTFTRPAGFQLEEHFRCNLGISEDAEETIEVSVKFTGPVARVMKNRSSSESPQQAWRRAEDMVIQTAQPVGQNESTEFKEVQDEPGALTTTFHVSDPLEFKRWIKGFAGGAEVLEPAWLRRELLYELLDAAKQYQCGG